MYCCSLYRLRAIFGESECEQCEGLDADQVIDGVRQGTDNERDFVSESTVAAI